MDKENNRFTKPSYGSAYYVQGKEALFKFKDYLSNLQILNYEPHEETSIKQQ
jgi:hypothetical protein